MKLLVFDGNSVINRAFYAIRPLSAKDGTPTNAILGFFNSFFKAVDEQKPDYICVAFDLPGGTFRHKIYDKYKEKRTGMPDDLAAQLPIVKELLGLMGIFILSKPQYEADDIIGTVSRICDESSVSCFIVTGDRDDLQLVTENTSVLLTKTVAGKPVTEAVTHDNFKETVGLEPSQFLDLKALMGDPSDNIPGVPGIGEKTAMSLLTDFESLDKIYQNLDTLPLKAGVLNKLKDGRELAFLSRELATIDCHAIEFSPEEARPKETKSAELLALLERLNLNSMLSRFASNDSASPSPKAEAAVAKELSGEQLQGLLPALKKEKELCFAMSVGGAEFLCGGELYSIAHDLLPILKDTLEDSKIITHDAKALFSALSELDISPSVAFDTLLAGYILDPSKSEYSIPSLSVQYLGTENPSILALPGLYEKMLGLLLERGQESLYFDMELPLSKLLTEMERLGVNIDPKALEDFGAMLEEEIKKEEKVIYSLAGGEFNISSPKQLGEILFGKLGLPIIKKNKTGPSTDSDVLSRLILYSPIAQHILNYRQYFKLQSTYVAGLLAEIKEDGRIHTTFSQTVTNTGRLSSLNPNLQNIPVKTELGRELRRAFTAKDGYVLIDADYSQIELRVLSHIAGDKAMMAAFNENQDIHAITASQVFKTPLDEVTPSMRQRAKAVNFGIVYGIGDFTLSQNLSISRREAREYIDGYLDSFPGVRAYMESSVASAKEAGYVTTLLGRRRDVPELQSKNHNIKGFGERVAMNTPIQGTAADLIKLAMLKVSDSLKAEGLEARLILQVHDELLVEAPEHEREQAKKIVKREMEGVYPLGIPISCDISSGKTWFDAKL